MWRLRFDADDYAIECLREQSPDQADNITFTKNADHWLFETPASSSESEAKAALDAGNLVLDRLNFAASLVDHSFFPVRRSSTVVDDDGRANHFVTAQSAISLTSAGHAVVTTTGPAPATRQRTPGEIVLDLAPLVPEVDEVMGAWARDRSPLDLYKIFEIIRDEDRNGPCAIASLTAKSELSRFTHTVNHPGGAGDQARHARSGEQPPSNPMSAPEMVRFIAQLMNSWLRCLAEQNGVPKEAAATGQR